LYRNDDEVFGRHNVRRVARPKPVETHARPPAEYWRFGEAVRQLLSSRLNAMLDELERLE